MEIKLSLIIAFYNKIDKLKLVFAALERQTFKDFEVVIADDGSRQDIVDELNVLMARSPLNIQHIWHEDKGWQKNCMLNKAVRASKAPFLVFIDGDCIPEKNFLQDHYDYACKGEVSTGRRVLLTERITNKITVDSIFKGYIDSCSLFWDLLFDTVFCMKKTKMEQMFRMPWKWFRNKFIKERERFILGCNFSLYKDDLLKVNGFDERFVNPGYGEDIDLGNRLERVGIKTMSRKNLMIIYHTFHKHFFTDFPESLALLKQNMNDDPYVPSGINKI